MHTIITTSSYSRPGDYSNGIELTDTTYIEVPEYLCGQIYVSFLSEFDSSMAITKDSIGVEALEQNTLEDYKIELWGVQGYNLDTLYQYLDSDSRFRYVELHRSIQYDSVVT
jgi:hypothetical protein